MDSRKLVDRIREKIRCDDGNKLDAAYNSGLLEAVVMIEQSAWGSIERCPRCASFTDGTDAEVMLDLELLGALDYYLAQISQSITSLQAIADLGGSSKRPDIEEMAAETAGILSSYLGWPFASGAFEEIGRG